MTPKRKKRSWRSIMNGYYEVSDSGLVRRLLPGPCTWPGRAIRPGINLGGYPSMVLSVQGNRVTRCVHRLVAEAFLGPRPLGLEVNHKDGNKRNNSVENLEYVTKSQNNSHAFKIGLKTLRGEKNTFVRLSEIKVREIKALLTTGLYQKTIAAFYGVHPGTVSAIAIGRSWRHV